VQLAQPGLSLVWAALLLNEHLDAAGVLATAAIVACVAVAQRARIDTHTTALTTTVAQIAEGD
jgi:drug/metabolite transporter (DMT)-like permease